MRLISCESDGHPAIGVVKSATATEFVDLGAAGFTFRRGEDAVHACRARKWSLLVKSPSLVGSQYGTYLVNQSATATPAAVKSMAGKFEETTS